MSWRDWVAFGESQVCSRSGNDGSKWSVIGVGNIPGECLSQFLGVSVLRGIVGAFEVFDGRASNVR